MPCPVGGNGVGAGVFVGVEVGVKAGDEEEGVVEVDEGGTMAPTSSGVGGSRGGAIGGGTLSVGFAGVVRVGGAGMSSAAIALCEPGTIVSSSLFLSAKHLCG